MPWLYAASSRLATPSPAPVVRLTIACHVATSPVPCTAVPVRRSTVRPDKNGSYGIGVRVVIATERTFRPRAASAANASWWSSGPGVSPGGSSESVGATPARCHPGTMPARHDASPARCQPGTMPPGTMPARHDASPARCHPARCQPGTMPPSTMHLCAMRRWARIGAGSQPRASTVVQRATGGAEIGPGSCRGGRPRWRGGGRPLLPGVRLRMCHRRRRLVGPPSGGLPCAT